MSALIRDVNEVEVIDGPFDASVPLRVLTVDSAKPSGERLTRMLITDLVADFFGDDVTGPAIAVGTVQELRGLGRDDISAVYVAETQNWYYFDDASTQSDNGSSVLAVNGIATGRFIVDGSQFLKLDRLTANPQGNPDRQIVAFVNGRLVMVNPDNSTAQIISTDDGVTLNGQVFNFSSVPTAPDPDPSNPTDLANVNFVSGLTNALDARVTDIEALLQSDDVNLDTLQELVDFASLNRDNIENLGISGVIGLQTVLDGLTATNTQIMSDAADLSLRVADNETTLQSNNPALASIQAIVDFITNNRNDLDNLSVASIAGLQTEINTLNQLIADNDTDISGVDTRVTSVEALLQSDNVNLDELQEVVDFIEANRAQLDNLGIGGVIGLQAALTALENADTQQEADIATNTADIATNTADIATNTADIATNTAGVSTNATDIDALEVITDQINEVLINTYDTEALLAAVDVSAVPDGLIAFTANKSANDVVGGTWSWDSTNLNLAVGKDPLHTIFLPPSSDVSGASGAWVRQFEGAVQMAWGGFDWTGATDQTQRLADFFSTFNTRTFHPLLSDVQIEAPNIGTKRLLIDGAGDDAGGVVVTGVRAHLSVDFNNTEFLCGSAGNRLDNAAMLFATNTPFDVSNKPRIKFKNATWNMRNMDNSQVVPFRDLLGVVSQGQSNVCDGLNIRTTYQVTLPTGATERRNGWDTFEMENCRFIASDNTWENAGGDSGCYVEGVDTLITRRVRGVGLRDAILYPSRRDGQPTTNMRVFCYDMEGEGCFFCITPKRELNHVVIEGGYSRNCVRAHDFSGEIPLSSGLDSEGGREIYIDNHTYEGCENSINIEDADDITIGSGVVVRNPGHAMLDGTRLNLTFSDAQIVLQGCRDFTINNPKFSGVNDNIATGSRTSSAALELGGVTVNGNIRGCENGNAKITVYGQGVGSNEGFLSPAVNLAYPNAADVANRTNNCVIEAHALNCANSNIIQSSDGTGNLFQSLDVNEGGVSFDQFMDWADQDQPPAVPTVAGRNRLYFDNGVLFSVAAGGVPQRITPFDVVSGSTESASTVGNDQPVSTLTIPADTVRINEEIVARFGFEAAGAANIIPKLRITDGNGTSTSFAGSTLQPSGEGMLEVKLLNIAATVFRASIKIITGVGLDSDVVTLEETVTCDIATDITIELTADITAGTIRKRSASARIV